MRYWTAGRRAHRRHLGTPPGSLTTSETAEPSLIHVMTYGPTSVEERTIEVDPGRELPDLPAEAQSGVRWINITRVQDGDLLRALGGRLGMHPLMLEDIQQVDQRPKLQNGEASIFGVVRMITWDDETERLENEQVALFSSGRTVVSFQERPGDVFDGIRERIRSGGGRVRSSGVDYLFYVLIDAIVDSLSVPVDHLQAGIEDIEEQIIRAPTDVALSRIHELRGEVVSIRRLLWPLREMLRQATAGDFPFFNDHTLPFLADSQDHVLSLMDLVDPQIDRVTGLFQLHAAMLGTSTNEIMRVLTIIATIFIPLTFLVGIYGMNFSVMPELQWRYGYPTLVGVMVLVAVGMVVYFKRKRWF